VTSGRRGVGLMPMETRRDVIVRTAVLADELGYEIFAVPEGWELDSAPVLTEIALRTARIVCGGRYLLGLGASTQALAEGFHGTAFEHPAAKLRDAVTKVRALLAGQPAQLGQAPAARPLRLGQPLAPTCPSRSPRWPLTRSGWRPSSVTAGSPRWWPGTASPAGQPSSASCAKPPPRRRDP